MTGSHGRQLLRRVLAGRAFAVRAGEARLRVHRARNRRTLFLGELAPEDVAADIAAGTLFWREDWLEARARPAPAGGRPLSAPPPVPEAPERRRGCSGLERVLTRATDSRQARVWARAAAQLLADLEAGAAPAIRTMAWGADMRVRDAREGQRAGGPPRAGLAALRLAELKSRFDGAEWADLDALIVREAAISPLTARRGVSRAAMERRMAGLLSRLAEAYALSLPMDPA